jgi:hypothetical protein
MTKFSARFASVGAFIAMLGATMAADASPTPAPSPTVASTPGPASPMLVGLWKGYAPSLGRSVFISWVRPASTSSKDLLAAIDDAFEMITPKLKGTPYSIFIINVELTDESDGDGTGERGFIFVRQQDGRWESLSRSNVADKGAFVNQVLSAGLPQVPGIDGGVTLAAPLRAAESPSHKPTPKP